MGIGHTVRTDQTVVAEVVVAGIKAVEVTTVSIDHLAVLAFPAYGLIDEVPDETTLVFRIFTDDVPILLETTLGVTHRMSILALDQRLLVGCVFAIFDAVLIVVIHRAEDVGLAILACLLILHGTGGILCLDPVVSRLEVGAIAGLITKRPEDDAGVVIATLHVALVAL